MTSPLTIDLPHSLGAEEARRRIADGIGRLTGHLPGAAEVDSQWQGDRLSLHIQAMGQSVAARIDVEEKVVRVAIDLPPMLAFFGNKIAGLLRSKGGALLEDKRKA